MENDFLATEKDFPTLKSHFISFFQVYMYFLRQGQNSLSKQKLFCPTRWTGHNFQVIMSKMKRFIKSKTYFWSKVCQLVPNEFYSMLGRTGHQLIQIVFLHRGNCMLFYFWRGENEKTAFAPLFFLYLPVSQFSVQAARPLNQIHTIYFWWDG